MVKATASCGAVRHGAECFNFYFPQELDEEFLCVWEGFGDAAAAGLGSPSPTRQPWKMLSEPELRAFLLDRCADGFSFPLNPIWPIRDKGWHEVLQALQTHEEAVANLASWFPDEVLQTIEEVHAAHPGGFTVLPDHPAMAKHSSFFAAISPDLDTREMADFAMLEVRRETHARWQRIRGALRMHLLHAPND